MGWCGRGWGRAAPAGVDGLQERRRRVDGVRGWAAAVGGWSASGAARCEDEGGGFGASR